MHSQQQQLHSTLLAERIERLNERAKAFSNARSLTAELQKDSAFRAEVKDIYSAVFGKQLTGCISCIADAVFEIINTKNTMEKAKLEYWLRAGVLLHDKVNLDSSKVMSNVNITEQLSLYHLATNPGCEELFDRLPHDWQSRVSQYKKNVLNQSSKGMNADANNTTVTPAKPKSKTSKHK